MLQPVIGDMNVKTSFEIPAPGHPIWVSQNGSAETAPGVGVSPRIRITVMVWRRRNRPDAVTSRWNNCRTPSRVRQGPADRRCAGCGPVFRRTHRSTAAHIESTYNADQAIYCEEFHHVGINMVLSTVCSACVAGSM